MVKCKKVLYIITVLVVSFVAALAFINFLGKENAEATWYDDIYAYRIRYSFTHNANITSERAITVSLDTAELITATLMQSDCDDTRFTDAGGRILKFQLTGTCNNAATTYEVVFPSVNNGTNVGFIYYGNPAATSASQDVSGVTTLTPNGGDPSITDRTNETIGKAPISYWNLDEGGGSTLNDYTNTHNNDLTITGATWAMSGLCNSENCLSFDGTGDYASKTYSSDTELDPGTSSFTISAWFKQRSSISVQRNIITRADGVNGVGYKVYLNSSGNACFGIDASAGSFPSDSACSSTSYADSTWHHVVGVKTGTSSITLYIDGILIATDASITGSSISGTSSAFKIGIDTDNSSNPWVGFIDEVRYYNYAKTASQISNDYVSRQSNEYSSATLGSNATKASFTSGMVGYWDLEEGTGTSTTERSGNAFTGTLTNSPTWGTGKFGTAVVFDGSDDYIDAGDQTSLELTTFTLSAWIYRTGSCNAFFNCTIISKGQSGNIGYSLAARSQDSGTTYNVALDLRDFQQIVYGTTNIATNTWYHVSATIDGSTVKVYLNGKLENQAVQTVTPTYSTETFKIGNRNGSTIPFQGSIDEVRVHNRALNNNEILQMYTFARGPVGWWKLDEATGQTALDSSGNNITTTLGADSGSASDDPQWVRGKQGGALDFDGSNDFLGNNDDNANIDMNTYESFTVSAWINRQGNAAFNNPMFILDNHNSGTNAGYYLAAGATSASCSTAVSDGELICFRVIDGTDSYGIATTTSVLANSGWNYITAVFDNTSEANTLIYINGVPQLVTRSGTFANIDSPNNSDAWCIGANAAGFGCNGSTSNVFNGLLDDLKIYNYARTPAQIVEDMNAGHPLGGSPIASQTVYWPFDEMHGSTTYNLNTSQSGITGTLGTGTSAPTWLQTSSCKLNACLHFNSAPDNVSGGDVSFSDNASALTWAFWINPLSLSTNRSLISKNNTSQKNFAIVTDASNSDELRVHVAATTGESDNTTYFATSNLDLSASTWQHVTVVYNGTEAAANRVKVYKDGILKTGSVTGNLPAASTSGTTSVLRVGDDESSTYTSLEMLLDEVKIYNAALSETDIFIDKNANSTLALGGVLNNSPNQGFGGSGPIVYIDFDHTSTSTAYDLSGNGNNGTFRTSAAAAQTSPNRVTGKIGKGIALNAGTNAYVDLASDNLNSAGSYTISAWINPDNFSNDYNIVRELAAGFDFYVTTDQRIRVLSNSQTADSRASVITAAAWQHVAVTYNGGTTYAFYVNGQNVTEDGTGSSANASSTLYIGHGTNHFQGRIDEVKIFDYTLTPGQISYDYNRGLPVAHYQLDECSGTSLYNNAKTGSGGAAGFNAVLTVGGSGTNTSTGSCGSATSTEAWNNGTTGKINYSLDFDGTDDYAEITDSANSILDLSTSLTMMAWVYKDAISGNDTIISKAGNGYGCYTNDDEVGISINGTTAETSNVNMAIGTWYHITCVYEDLSTDRAHIYVNGNLVYSADFAGGSPTVSNNSLFVGASSATPDNPFNGRIDEIRLYNYPLSVSQIKTALNEGASARFSPQTGSP